MQENISLENTNASSDYSSEPVTIEIDQSNTAEYQSMDASIVESGMERRNSVVDNPEAEPEDVHHDSQQAYTSPNYASKLQRSSSMPDLSGASGCSAENLRITTRPRVFSEEAYSKKRLDDKFDYSEGMDSYTCDHVYENPNFENRSDSESYFEDDLNHLNLLGRESSSEDEDDLPELELQKKNQEQTYLL